MGTWIALGLGLGLALGLSGCTTEVVSPGVGAPATPKGSTAPGEARAAIGGPAIAWATTATLHADELVSFIDQSAGPDFLPPDVRRELTSGRGPKGDNAIETIVQRGEQRCFIRLTPRDGRAAVVPRSSRGFLMPSAAWMSAAVELVGGSTDGVQAFYGALGRRLGEAGRASGLARFDNGNAMVIDVELHDLEEGDVELIARSTFKRAGDYDPKAWEVTLDGATQVKTRSMNKHRGVSVFDMLRLLPPPAKPTPTSAT